jgi:hypothetical protein
MLKKLKQRFRPSKKSSRPSVGGPAPDPADNTSTNNPTPPAAAPVLPADPNHALQAYETPLDSMPDPVPQPKVAALVQAPAETSPTNAPQATDTPLPLSSNVAVKSPSADESLKHTAWAGLDNLAGVLRGGVSFFGPLKSAVDGIAEVVGVYEVRAFSNQGRNHL